MSPFFKYIAPLVLLSISACNHITPAHSSDQLTLKNSLKTWTTFKKAHAGNYHYTVRTTSAFGSGSLTTIWVRNNQVVKRTYNSWDKPTPVVAGAFDHKPEFLWVENANTIGKNTQGAAAQTVDEKYQTCHRVLAQKLAAYEKRYLKFNNEKLLTHCFTIDTRIMDDTPQNGVSPFDLFLD